VFEPLLDDQDTIVWESLNRASIIDGLRGEDSIAELCRKEGIAQSLYCTWSKEFMEAGKRRIAGDTDRAAPTSETQDSRLEARALKDQWFRTRHTDR
jgi:transposase-like protein